MLPETVALLAAALLLGAMAFFSFIVAPMVFVTLEAPLAARVIRALFPVYYLVIIGLGAATALPLAIAGRPVDAAAMAFVAGFAALLRQGLLPRLDALRAAKEAGDAVAVRRFARLHRASVAVNMAQLLATAAILLRLAL